MAPGMFLRRLAADREGAVAVMLALALPVLVGVSALAIETGLWFTERRVLQNAADAAALSGAFELTAGRRTTVLPSALA
ncbi:MAG TPA: pilus assembly protein TadG-related protein, partial [Magnetospirillum sp.]|nr:pilus assembly protein TadG-related protein [Magnetospirillum sp.]